MNKLVLKHIIKGLGSSCDDRSVHTCLVPFRSQPASVLRWRKLWYSLPKQDREARLVKMFENALANHKTRRFGDSSSFLMTFNLFGASVCRRAFIQLTGIHADTLQKARGRAVGDRDKGCMHRHEPAGFAPMHAMLVEQEMRRRLFLPAACG